MTSKELVNICKKTNRCSNCNYKLICDAYALQFGCYPTDTLRGKNFYGVPTPQEANSNTTIQLTEYIV